MASSVGFGTVAPAPAGARALDRRAARPSSSFARVPATKVVAAAEKQEEKGLFDTIFGALYKEEQLLETDPILNKVEGKAPAAAAPPPAPKKAAGKAAAAEEESGNGGFSLLGGLFKKG